MRVFVIAVLFSISLFATVNYKNNSLAGDYDRAVKAYKAKDYKTSYRLLSKLYLTNLSNDKLSFYLGRSAYETGHYEIALAAFERVEMLNPKNLRNKLEKARTFFMLEMYEESELAFKEVLNNPDIPKNVRTNIELFLAKVSKAQKKSFTYVNIGLDWIYDSNVNYASLDDSYNIGDITLPTTSEKSDSATQVYADIVNVYDIGKKNGFAIKNRVSVFLKDYSKEVDYDLQYFGYIPTLVYKGNKYKVELSVGFDVLTLGKKDYMHTVYFMPTYERSHTNTLKSTTYFKLQRKLFKQSDKYDLNAKHYELYYSLLNILNPHSYIQGNITAIREQKEHGSRIDVDYDEYKFGLVYANQFTSKYTVQANAQIKKRNYKDYSNNFNSKREDIGRTFGASFNAKILPTLTAQIKANYDKVDSNQNVYGYHKYTLSVGLVKTF